MVVDGLQVYQAADSDVPLCNVVVRMKSLPLVYVDASQVAEVIVSRKSDPVSVKNSRLERLAEALTGTGNGQAQGNVLGKA